MEEMTENREVYMWNFNEKYDFFKGGLYTSDKFKVFLNYWIADLLIDLLRNDVISNEENRKKIIRDHYDDLYKKCFSENIIGNKDLVDSFNHNFLEKIHSKLHLSKKFFVKEGEMSVLEEDGKTIKEEIINYILENILQSDLIRNFVYNTLLNVGGKYSKMNPGMSKNVKKTGLFSKEVETKIIIFQFINLLKFNHIGYLNLVFNVDFEKKEITDRTDNLDLNNLREIESAFVFDDLTSKLPIFATEYIAKDKNSTEPKEFFKYDTRKKLMPRQQNEEGKVGELEEETEAGEGDPVFPTGENLEQGGEKAQEENNKHRTENLIGIETIEEDARKAKQASEKVNLGNLGELQVVDEEQPGSV